jgi:hypothetical protein
MKRLDDAKKKEILKLHAAGKSINEISGIVGSAWPTVKQVISAAGEPKLNGDTAAPRHVVDPLRTVRVVPEANGNRISALATLQLSKGASDLETVTVQLRQDQLDSFWGMLGIRGKAELLFGK